MSFLLPRNLVYTPLATCLLLPPVTVCVPPEVNWELAKSLLPAGARVVEMSSNDAWMRDIGPTFVEEVKSKRIVGIDWGFNAWGGEEEGCYDGMSN